MIAKVSSNLSFRLQNLPVTLTALINDTTGTLIASHYVNPRTKIAVIFGTGCNAAYMENVSSIEKIADLGIASDAQMAINCEWGAFDSFEHEHLPRTSYDVTVDETSNKPGEQAFEASRVYNSNYTTYLDLPNRN
jgi:hexokinase